MMGLIRAAAGVLLVAMLGGCTSGFARYYVPTSLAAQHPPVPAEQVTVIRSGERSPQAVRRELAPDAQLVGTSQFTSSGANDSDLRDFAGSVGADLVIWGQRWRETVPYIDYRHRTNTTTIRTTDNHGHETVTRMTDTEAVPYTRLETIYTHTALFLRTDRAPMPPAEVGR